MDDSAPRELTPGEVTIAGHTGDRQTVHEGSTHHDAAVRIAALGALARLDEITAEHLAVALRDPDTGVRRRAAELAAVLPDVDLTGALDDPDPGVVEVAAWACGEHETTDARVIRRLTDLATTAGDPLVRESAAAALGAIGDELGLDAILAACRDKPAVRRRAVLALAPFLDGPRDREVRAALAAALDDRDWQVRQSAEDLTRADGGTSW